MVMPLWDDNPFKRPKTPWVTWGLIGTNCIGFAAYVSAGPEVQAAVTGTFGVVPAAVLSNTSLVSGFPPALTLLTYQFLHFGWMHLIANMLFLFVFGDNVEEATGSFRFLLFYLACGVVAALTYVASGPASFVPLGGASGAVAGVIGAYLLLRPCARITVIVLYIALRVRAYWVIGGWALLQLWQIETRTNDNIAYWAHIGGLLGGMGLLPLLRHQGVRLFECVDSPPVL